jgi:hypothetical protein
MRCLRLEHIGMLSAQLALAKAAFIAGEFDDAERALHTCIKLDPACAQAHMIYAQVTHCSLPPFRTSCHYLTVMCIDVVGT